MRNALQPINNHKNSNEISVCQTKLSIVCHNQIKNLSCWKFEFHNFFDAWNYYRFTVKYHLPRIDYIFK